MCGIGMFWAKESTLSFKQYDALFLGAERRGQDGFGAVILDQDMKLVYSIKDESYKAVKGSLYMATRRHLLRGGFLLFSSRATPETEPPTAADSSNIQPIVYPMMASLSDIPYIYLAHNGGITDSIAKRYFEGVQRITTLDSEAIIAAYVREQYNMREVMERLSGSFAFILLDQAKKSIYAVTGFNPLAHMYIRGVGYFIHSELEALEEVLHDQTGASRDGMNVWESWYHHYIEGYQIIETDTHSGFQRKQTYEPNFLHPTWNKVKKAFSEKEKAIVVASGGVDSGVTAMLLTEAGYDVEMLHFDYGQRSEKCERWAAEKLSIELKIGCNTIDLSEFFNDYKDTSFLLNDEYSGELTGGDLIKSTVAWVPGRNAVFASMAMAIAEANILSGVYSKVYIAAGWNQLSEETGGYPDNSFQFNRTLELLKMYGYITGTRIEFLPVLQRLTKTETWYLGDKFQFPFGITVSCDTPIWDSFYQMPKLCPECGSTKLSIIAADRAGVIDRRLFTKERPTLGKPVSNLNAQGILNRLALSAEKIILLKKKLDALGGLD